MPKTEGTRQRLLALQEILTQETDDTHRLTAQELEQKLLQRGITAEKKSIYRDISILVEEGMDIVKSIRDLIEISASPTPEHKGKGGVKMTRQELAREIEKLEAQMRKAAHMMEYEYAAVLRDEIIRLRTEADKK